MGCLEELHSTSPSKRTCASLITSSATGEKMEILVLSLLEPSAPLISTWTFDYHSDHECLRQGGAYVSTSCENYTEKHTFSQPFNHETLLQIAWNLTNADPPVATTRA